MVRLNDDAGQVAGLIGLGFDITDRKQTERERMEMEFQLQQAQKLESIGRLAAGIAHEINTPTQYIGDNARFVQEAFTSLNTLFEHYEQLRQAAERHGPLAGLAARIAATAREADVPYLMTEIPKAASQSLEGVARVARIVRAMREFSHPGSAEKMLVSLNQAIESTVTVARNEWKYVADLVLDLEPSLTPVHCLPGEFNQVILNLVINAAQAIADKVGDGRKGKGTIVVSSRRDGEWVEVRVKDTGNGIPKNIQHRVFEPFFTTKPVGKGTGQGLAIARSVISARHGGTITFESEEGVGTTFIVRLPIDPPEASPCPEAA
jgi:signal transduction histidine kinase